MRLWFTFFTSLALSLVLSLSLAFAEPGYFERDSLNTGLSVPPESIDRSTPRQTIESLFRAAEAEQWDNAAHVLDLSDLDPEQQQAFGGELARKLKVVLDRKVVIDWDKLVDRPDGFDAYESSRAATSGMPRKSLRLWELSTGQVPTSIRIERVKVGAEDPVWVFSKQTVEDILPLFEKYGPSNFENWLPPWAKSEGAWGLMRWEYIGLPLLTLLAGAAGWLVFRLVKLVEKNAGSHVVERTIRATATPLVIATVTTALWWGISTVFVFSGKLDAFLSPMMAIGFVTAALMLVANVFEGVLDKLIGFDDIDLTQRQGTKERARATRVAAIRRILTLIIFLVGVGVVLSTANWFPFLGYSLLASAGAVTLVLGFAARQVLSNIMASLQIALNQSAQIGDRVVYKDHLCHVERINFTFVQLRDWDGTRLVVPVEEFISETFENWTLKEPEMLRILKFKLDPSVNLKELRKAFEDVLSEIDPDELDDTGKAKVVVTGQDVFGIDVWFYVPCVDPNTSWDVACEAREALVGRMNELEAKPTITIFPDAPAAEAA